MRLANDGVGLEKGAHGDDKSVAMVDATKDLRKAATVNSRALKVTSGASTVAKEATERMLESAVTTSEAAGRPSGMTTTELEPNDTGIDVGSVPPEGPMTEVARETKLSSRCTTAHMAVTRASLSLATTTDCKNEVTDGRGDVGEARQRRDHRSQSGAARMPGQHTDGVGTGGGEACGNYPGEESRRCAERVDGNGSVRADRGRVGRRSAWHRVKVLLTKRRQEERDVEADQQRADEEVQEDRRRVAAAAVAELEERRRKGLAKRRRKVTVTPRATSENDVEYVGADDGLPTAMVKVTGVRLRVKPDRCARCTVAGTEWMAYGDKVAVDAPVDYGEGIGGFY
ncbi:hypothetical protein ON010_g18283 [Phytophthora cinnamomi]|nr:hypothetical protein ON010_g18283 [Phytophthora cinnamomi]